LFCYVGRDFAFGFGFFFGIPFDCNFAGCSFFLVGKLKRKENNAKRRFMMSAGGEWWTKRSMLEEALSLAKKSAQLFPYPRV